MNAYETKVEQFLVRIQELGAKFLPDAQCAVLNKSINFLKIRFQIRKDMFFDVYYNSFRERKDFALVFKGKRIFGYDNYFGWHLHPSTDPDSHVFCQEPPLVSIFKEVKEIIKKNYKM